MSASTIAEHLFEASKLLSDAGIVEPRFEAGLLLSNVMGRDRTFLIVNSSVELDDSQAVKFREYVDRRAAGEPAQYIIGHKWFFNLDFEVAPGVLIPRPETELLVEKALTLISPEQSISICDVGVGTGCILISILDQRKNAKGLGLDILPRALEVANRNAVKLGTIDRIEFRLSDLFSAVQTDEEFDLIVSNPPYIAEGTLKTLQREVRDHEPIVALISGPDGLNMIRRLLADSAEYLKAGGFLLLEIGFDQSVLVKALAEQLGWLVIEMINDLQGIPRIVVLQKETV